MSKQKDKEQQYSISQAFKQGKRIQSSPKGQNNWKDIPQEIKIMLWDWKHYDYRIKE